MSESSRRELFDFAALVATMRSRQKKYFVTRSQEVLQECRSLERKVDAELKRIRDLEQPRLFEDAESPRGPH